MAADITSSGVMSSPCALRSPSSRALKSMGGKEAPGRPSIRGRDFSTWDGRLQEKEEENKIEEKKSVREDKRCEVEKQGKEEREKQIIFNLIHV